MNHLVAKHQAPVPELAMQMSTHLLEPASIMRRKIKTKTVHYTVGTNTGILSQMGDRIQHWRKLCTNT